MADRASRDIRRNAFLNRVKQGREDSRFNAREDGMLWMEYITAKRRFEEEMGRSAPQIDNVEDEAMDTQADGEPHESMRVDERNWDGELTVKFV